MSICCTI